MIWWLLLVWFNQSRCWPQTGLVGNSWTYGHHALIFMLSRWRGWWLWWWRNDAGPQLEGDIIWEKRRNGKLGRLRKQEGLLLDDTTFQTALLETNNPTTKYKLSSVHKITETEEKSLIETFIFDWNRCQVSLVGGQKQVSRVEQSPPSTCIYN